MNFNKITQEFIAPTVEEAIEQGARVLGIPADQLEVEVLDQGNKGLFGLGSRQARVRLSIVNPIESQLKEPEVDGKESEQSASPEVQQEETEPVLALAESVVGNLLTKMGINAKVESKFLPAIDEHDQETILVEILGRDLSILIGRRSETLNALQFISSMILTKEYGSRVPLIIDVQGYRERRERQLKVLARRMAEQVVHTGRRQNLEPMPANERRIIHLALKDHQFVQTESVGDEPNRKVTIILKK
jgi:spoIIIJ-associated protein